MDKEKVDRRMKEYLKTPDVEEIRRQREDDHVQLRKAKRNEQFTQRRAKVQTATFEHLPANLLHAIPQLEYRSLNSLAKFALLISFLKKSSDPGLTFEAISLLRKGIASDNFSAKNLAPALIEAGISDVLCTLLRQSNTEILVEATWCLLNLTYCDGVLGSSGAGREVVNSVVELIRHPDEEVAVNCLWTLGNIAGDTSLEMKDLLRSFDLLPKLIDFGQRYVEFSSENQSILIWTIGSIVKITHVIRRDIIFDCVSLIKSISRNQLECILKESVSTFLELSKTDYGVQSLVHTSCIPFLISLLSHNSQHVRSGALKTIGNVISYPSDEYSEKVVEAGFVEAVRGMTGEINTNLRQEIIWILSNLAIGPDAHKIAIIRDPLMSFVLSSAFITDCKVQTEVTHCLFNLLTDTENSLNFALKLAALGALEAIKHLFETNTGEDVVMRALKILDVILLAGVKEASAEKTTGTNKQAVRWDEVGGLSKMEDLQSLKSDAVYNEVVRIMDVYFGFEDSKESPTLLDPPARFEFS